MSPDARQKGEKPDHLAQTKTGTAGPVIEGKGLKWQPSQRKLGKKFIALIVLVIITLVGGGVYFVSSQQSSSDNGADAQANQAATACPDELIDKYAAVESPEKLAEQRDIVAKIETLPDYGKDPNCTFVTTSYYIATGDYDKSKENYDNFVRYSSKPGNINSRLEISDYQHARFKDAIAVLKSDKDSIESRSNKLLIYEDDGGN